MYFTWLRGGFAARTGRALGTIAAIAVVVVFLSSVGSFVSYSGASMTERAIAGVPVDWQVQAMPGTSIQAVSDALDSVASTVRKKTVAFADAAGFSATTGGSVQQTGAGKVVGIADSYRASFPTEFRSLVGADSGVLVAQQTAANLHVQPGDTVTIQRIGLPPVDVKVDGVVDMPYADSFFQAVGLPPTAAPQAPPDDVLIMPAAQWHALFDAQTALRPDTTRFQIHATIARNLPADPNQAFIKVQSLANNLEARLAGGALVGDNLAARLSAVRSDALYAKILFLFLGLPGAFLAILLVLFITSSGETHRRRERELLRRHGASGARMLRLQTMEAAGPSLIGTAAGVLVALRVDAMLIPFGSHNVPLLAEWTAFAAVAALVLAIVAVVLPAWREVRRKPEAANDDARRIPRALWKRAYFDLILLVASAVEFWRTASSGYSVVLAPEGVASISVNYEAFIGPFFLWIGGILLALRLFDALLSSPGGALAGLVTPTAGRLAGPVAASLSRDRSFLSRGILLVGLAISFAVSTSIFNTTYQRQARVDAELTNGSDVNVTALSDFAPGDKRIAAIAALPGVAAVQPMQHRFAYVGKDLQDLFGIDPATIGRATDISDAFFANKDAKSTLAALSATKDGILVSEETIKDFQLSTGDLINIRLQFASDHAYHAVPFHIVGVVREFPTAPKDSFFVANASYIAEVSGAPGANVLLVRTTGDAATTSVAAKAGAIVGKLDAKITEIGTTQRVIGSGITSMNLHGLTSIELVFAVILLASSVGLVLALGMAERRRNFAILRIVGAKKRDLDAFVRSETLIIFAGGLVAGLALGYGIAWMLVKVLSGVFDPPPEGLTVPWTYMATLFATTLLSTLAVSVGMGGLATRNAVEEIRNLS